MATPVDFPSPSLPTPLLPCPELSTAHADLWIKNDGLSHPVYGGNKVRKLERLIAEARARGATRLLTFGAAGSHHVLTTAIFARAYGLRAAAVLCPQHATPHVERTLRAALAQGLEVLPARALTLAGVALMAWNPRTDYVIPPGGSNAIGTLSYLDAVKELCQQLRDLGQDPPDVIVVPVGSGGTSAGLAAGIAANHLPTRLIGVMVVRNPLAPLLVSGLSRGALLRSHPSFRGRVRFELDSTYAGRGYGIPSEAGEHATQVAAGVGLTLDPTYTAKAFAKVLDLLDEAPAAGLRKRRILYWHTLSAAKVTAVRSEEPLPRALAALLVGA